MAINQLTSAIGTVHNSPGDMSRTDGTVLMVISLQRVETRCYNIGRGCASLYAMSLHII